MDKLKKAYRTTMKIGLAMMMSVFILPGIVELMRNGTIPLKAATPLPNDELNILKYVLFGISAVTFFMIRVITTQMLSANAVSGVDLRGTVKGRDAVPAEYYRLTSAAVVSYALCEAPALFGLVVFYLGRDASDFYVFMLISLGFFAVYFPDYRKWEAWVKRKGGA